MSQALLRHVQEKSHSMQKKVPLLQPGNRVKVHQKILEATKDGMKERLQIFEGLVIAIGSGAGVDKTFTVRKITAGVGVEKIFPLHSKNIAKIEVVSHSKIRRSKLYFMRDRSGKSARLKEAKLMGFDLPDEPVQEVTEEVVQEAVEAAKRVEEETKAQAAEAVVPEVSPAEPAEEAKSE